VSRIPVVKEVVERYLDCGNPRSGFARIRCPDCRAELSLSVSHRAACLAPETKAAGFWAGSLTVVLASAFFYGLHSESRGRESGRQASPSDLEVLSPADKAELAEILRLKSELGGQVWPGLSRLDLPLIFYNEHAEFLKVNKLASNFDNSIK